MTGGRSEKVRIIVLFGDISGFTAFCDAVTNDELEYDPFMERFDRLVDQAAHNTGYTFTDTGDGFMCTVDLEPGNCSGKAVEVVLNLWNLFKTIERLVERKKLDPPSPDGFRIVGAAGYVKRKVKKDGKIVLRGKHINRAHNLLDKARGKGFVCDESLKHLISERLAKKSGINFKLYEDSLWILSVN